jgi:hypothetical protein
MSTEEFEMPVERQQFIGALENLIGVLKSEEEPDKMHVIGATFGVLKGIAAMTPNKVDDEVVRRLEKVLEGVNLGDRITARDVINIVRILITGDVSRRIFRKLRRKNN